VELSDVVIDSSIVLLVADSDDIVTNSDVAIVNFVVGVSNRQIYRIIFTILFRFNVFIHNLSDIFLLHVDIEQQGLNSSV
jgi:hypothetical protein